MEGGRQGFMEGVYSQEGYPQKEGAENNFQSSAMAKHTKTEMLQHWCSDQHTDCAHKRPRHAPKRSCEAAASRATCDWTSVHLPRRRKKRPRPGLSHSRYCLSCLGFYDSNLTAPCVQRAYTRCTILARILGTVHKLLPVPIRGFICCMLPR